MAINLEAKGKTLKSLPFDWTWKDVALYNTGIGATEVEFTWEAKLKVLPTYAVVAPFPTLLESLGLVGGNPMTLLHGEQKIEILEPNLPKEAKTITDAKIGDIWDKGKGAVYTIETLTKTTEGQELFKNVFSVFLRGAGGFGGDKGPAVSNEAPDREPDAVVEDQTLPNQHLVYRLSGDLNPLHIDPGFAKMAGFDKPILHGLCSFGFVGRAVLKAFMDNDPAKMAGYEVRFRNVVFPGQKIITKMWKEDGKILINADTDDGRNVIANAAAYIRE